VHGTHSINKGTHVAKQHKKIRAVFYRNKSGKEPVREWLKADVNDKDRRIIGGAIATVEYGWPVGMPVCRPLSGGLYEVRCSLTGKRIARVLFCIEDGRMILLHGFIKKTQKTPKEALDLAKKRMKEILK
jgi:phage-related protein